MDETKVTRSEYVSVTHVAQVLGVCRMTVYRMCWDGTLPHLRVGRGDKPMYRIHRAGFDEYLSAQTRASAPAPSWAWQHPGQTEIPA